MSLEKYHRKRKFDQTPEPKASKYKEDNQLRFVVQEHHASHLHYDFRIELEGVMKSWAIPKGPSLNPKDKRLAVMVEDHPLAYRTFEGVIPEGNYGAGSVIIWDEGTYHALGTAGKSESERLVKEGLRKGHISIVLEGEKLCGEFALVKFAKAEDNSWLLIKKDDECASLEDVTKMDRSVVTGRTVDEVAASQMA